MVYSSPAGPAATAATNTGPGPPPQSQCPLIALLAMLGSFLEIQLADETQFNETSG